MSAIHGSQYHGIPPRWLQYSTMMKMIFDLTFYQISHSLSRLQSEPGMMVVVKETASVMFCSYSTSPPPSPLVMMIDFLCVRQKRLVSGIFTVLSSLSGYIHISSELSVTKLYFIKHHRKSSTFAKQNPMCGLSRIKTWNIFHLFRVA